MKRKTKKTLIIIAAALAVIVLAMGLVMLLRKDSFGDNYFTRNKAVATVNGVKITRNEFKMAVSNYYSNIDYYNMYAMYYGYGTYYDKNSEEDMKRLKNDILNNLIDAEISIQMAKDFGLTLTDEEKEQVSQAAKDSLASLKSQILQSAQSSGSQTPETYAVSMLASYFSNMGIDQSTYLKRSEHSAMAEKYTDKLQEYFITQRNVSEAELPDIYAEYVKANFQDVYQDGDYTERESYVAAGYINVPYLYIPEDFIFVRVIQLSDEEKAQEIMTAIEGGEDFETFFASDDNANETGKNLGEGKAQAIGAKDSAFDDEVYKQVGLAGIGQVILVPVEQTVGEVTEKTFYIIKRMEGTTGVIPYEDVKDLVDGDLKRYAGSKYYNEQTDAWRAKASIVIDDDAVQAYNPAA